MEAGESEALIFTAARPGAQNFLEDALPGADLPRRREGRNTYTHAACVLGC